MESELDKVTIKNILFTKALPNYTIPVSTNGYKIYPCRECGDKFLFESSYNDHINRKSLKITYFCRHCNKVIINKNRCRLLSHIRSHAFKTTTINVSDLKIEPLPIQDIKWTLPIKKCSQVENQPQESSKKNNVCHECKINIDKSDNIYYDRVAHYMMHTNMVYSCPICMFSLPTICALTAHLRIHLKMPPYFCPECGFNLPTKSITYPYNHDCEGFNMMRATTRLRCKQKRCQRIFHPNDYKAHVKSHFGKVYKCLTCLAIWNNLSPDKHTSCNQNKIAKYLQCHLCTHKLLFKNEVNKHLNSHFKSLTEGKLGLIYPCKTCNLACNDIHNFINHQIEKHASNKMKDMLVKILQEYNNNSVVNDNKRLYRVIKKCENCLRSFLYRGEFNNLKILPNECPYKCSSNKNTKNIRSQKKEKDHQIVCYLCKHKIKENWEDIKNHFAKFHKNHKCLDLKLILTKINNKIPITYKKTEKLKCLKKNITTLINNKSYSNKNKISTKRKNHILLNTSIELQKIPKEVNVCNICNYNCENKKSFETHIITHKDPCMAYQCLECGQSFVVKPSFSTHLLVEHGIMNVEDYINEKQCYNESALLKQLNNEKPETEPIKENQCKICRDQFESIIELEKHFRVHGMAFLMKTKNSP